MSSVENQLLWRLGTETWCRLIQCELVLGTEPTLTFKDNPAPQQLKPEQVSASYFQSGLSYWTNSEPNSPTDKCLISRSQFKKRKGQIFEAHFSLLIS